MIDDLTFLEEGRFTQRDNLVKQIAEEIKSNEKNSKIPVFQAIGRYIRQKLRTPGELLVINREFRKRTASEIIQSGYSNGCTDDGLVFVTLARTLGIPARYVETLRARWLRGRDILKVQGHIFTDIKIDKDWRTYEPTTGFCPEDKYFLRQEEYLVVGKGLDFSQVYEFKNGIFQPQPVDFSDIVNIARQIRKDFYTSS